MTYTLKSTSTGGRFVTFIDDAGNPPCHPPDGCRVCVLFSQQRPNETSYEWLTRITGIPQLNLSLEAS